MGKSILHVMVTILGHVFAPAAKLYVSMSLEIARMREKRPKVKVHADRHHHPFLSLSRRMGSLTSMPKKIPCADADDHDADYSPKDKESAEEALDRCRRHLNDLPPPIERQWRSAGGRAVAGDPELCCSEGDDSAASSGNEEDDESLRVLQWNVLSQGEANLLPSQLTHCVCSSFGHQERQLRALPGQGFALALQALPHAGGNRPTSARHHLLAGAS